MADEAVSTYLDQLTYEAMRLYFRAVPNNYPLLYLDKWTDKAIIAQLAAVEIAWHYYAYPIPACELADASFE